MTRRQDSAKRTEWKELMAGQEDFLRPLIQEVVRQVLEAEMEEAVGAESGPFVRLTGSRTANSCGGNIPIAADSNRTAALAFSSDANVWSAGGV